MKRKPTYEQSLALEKAQAARRANARRRAAERDADTRTPEELARWAADFKAAKARAKEARARRKTEEE